MSNLQSNLKQWGAQGVEYPDGYSYVAGEQPIDSWDNFVLYNAIEEIHALQSLANSRLESSASSTEPAAPEAGQSWYDPDNGNLSYYDGTTSSFHRLLNADGDTMSGDLNMGGYAITSTTGTVSVTGTLSPESLAVGGADLHSEWFSKQEGGTVSAGSFVPIGTFGLDAGDELYVSQAMLTKDGLDTPAPTGVNLIIVVSDGYTVTLLSGDGATLYDSLVSNPVASYVNTTGGHVTAAIGIDNGHHLAGTGSDTSAYGGFIARVI